MRFLHESSNQSQSERAFFAALAALNAKIESARAGTSKLGHTAQSCESLMHAFIQEIQSSKPKNKPSA